MPHGFKISNYTDQILFDFAWTAGVDYEEEEFQNENEDSKEKEELKTTMKKNQKKLPKRKPVQPYVHPTGLGHQTQGINTWQPAMWILKKYTQKKQVH